MTQPHSNVLEDLKAARALIADEANWSRGWGQGNKRCAVHAIADATTTSGFPEANPRYRLAFNHLRSAIGGNQMVSQFNDTRTHAEVLAAFDEAIRWASK